MLTTRRKFFADAGIAVGTTYLIGTGGLIVLESGCNSAKALGWVQKFEPVVVNVIVLACIINTGLPICGGMQATIKADADLVIKLWGDYNAIAKAGGSTSAIWNDLNAAFLTFEKDSADIFAAGLGLNAPEVTAIVAAAQVLLAAIEAVFPAPPAGAQATRPSKFGAYRMGIGNYDRDWFNKWAKDYDSKVGVAQKLHPQAQLRKVGRSWL